MPVEYTLTSNNMEFLRFHDWSNKDKEDGLMIFISDFGAEVLKKNKIWLMDGTFMSAPEPFKQVSISFFYIKIINLKARAILSIVAKIFRYFLFEEKKIKLD